MAAEAPGSPGRLGADGAALWERIVAGVTEGAELDPKERAWLEQACRAVDRAAELDSLVDAEGLMIAGSKDQARIHPAVGEARLQRQLAGSLIARIQLEPQDVHTARLNRRQRGQLRDARAQRWPRPAAGEGA